MLPRQVENIGDSIGFLFMKCRSLIKKYTKYRILQEDFLCMFHIKRRVIFKKYSLLILFPLKMFDHVTLVVATSSHYRGEPRNLARKGGGVVK